MMNTINKLSRQTANDLLISPRIQDLSRDQLLDLFLNNPHIQERLPLKTGETDPRSNERIIFNPSRAARPNSSTIKPKDDICPICHGNTTPIVDLADLSTGFTFINTNLFPAVYPHLHQLDNQKDNSGFPAWGMHFLQWTSSHHDQDWHNMDLADLSVVISRLGALENYLIEIFAEELDQYSVSIIKNGGLGAGGSLAHGHHQIIFSNQFPRRMVENQRFEEEHGQLFSEYILEENPTELVLRDFGEAVLLVPYFMRRPFNMMLVMKNTSLQYLHQLSTPEINSLCNGWKAAVQIINQVMSQINLEISYNILTHNGPGAGLYFEFLPRSQTEGGFEQLGYSICQSSPRAAVGIIRKLDINLLDC